MCDAASTVHDKDLLVVGKKNIMESSQYKIQEKLELDPREDLPRFSGLEYKRGQQGEMIVNCQHYIDNIEIPDLNQLARQTKKDVLGPDHQLIFKSLASKLNEVAQVIRPDILYAAKYLSTKSGKATKADMVQVERLIRKLKKIPNNIIIPDLGEPEDWMIAGVVNASHRTTGRVSAGKCQEISIFYNK